MVVILTNTEYCNLGGGLSQVHGEGALVEIREILYMNTNTFLKKTRKALGTYDKPRTFPDKHFFLSEICSWGNFSLCLIHLWKTGGTGGDEGPLCVNEKFSEFSRPWPINAN